MKRLDAREKQEAEARAIQTGMESLGYRVLYGGVKGEGFWVHGQGWARLSECKKMIARKVTP